MILLDVVDDAEAVTTSTSKSTVLSTKLKHDTKDTTRRPESLHSDTDSIARLPDYATSQAQVLHYRSRWRNRKFWRAVVVAFVIYLVVSACIAIPLIIKLRRSHKKQPYLQMWGKVGSRNQLPLDVVSLPPTYGDVVSCNGWTRTTSGTSTFLSLEYTIPVNETLSLRSNFSDLDDVKLSQAVSGNMIVNITNDASQKNATISVVMKKGSPDTVNTCLMRTMDGWGLAIYVPEDDITDNDDYLFEVSVQLPPSNGSPNLTAITTSLPSFNQTFKSLDSYGVFESFVAVGTLGQINIESVSAKALLVQNSAANITGKFTVSESAVLETVLASIFADISLHNDGYDNCPPTYLTVETGSSDIDINVTLYDGSPNISYTHPTFLSDIKTFGGSLDARFFHSNTSRPSALFVKARNNLQPAQIYVDSKFEGTYDVHTMLSSAIVDREADIPDPLQKARNRAYDDDIVSMSRTCGWTGWNARPNGPSRGQGHVEVVSSLSPAILQLTNVPDASRYSGKLSKSSFVLP